MKKILSNEEIEVIYNSAKKDITESVCIFEKAMFESYLEALFIKTVKTKTPEAEKQLQIINWMKNWIERQTLQNVINHVQTKMIYELERQLVQVYADNERLLTENQNLKENING